MEKLTSENLEELKAVVRQMAEREEKRCTVHQDRVALLESSQDRDDARIKMENMDAYACIHAACVLYELLCKL